MKTYRWTLCFVLLASFAAHAKRELIVGPEWEFTNHKGRKSTSQVRGGDRIEAEMRDQLQAYVKKLVENSLTPDLRPVPQGSDLYFDLADQSWFLFSTDPRVVEVHSSGRTIVEYKQVRPLIYKYIYDAARDAGFFFSENIEAAHMHFDFETAFGHGDGSYDYLLFRNFVVDFYNHSETYLGVLNNDQENAPGLDVGQRKRFQRLLTDFESTLQDQEWRKIPGKKLAGLIHDINTTIYKHAHYIALNLEHAIEGKFVFTMKKGGTIEVRGMAMRDFDIWLKGAEIFEARLNWLEQSNERIVLNLTENRPGPKRGALLFQKFVTEPGLRWNEYREVMRRSFRCVDAVMGRAS